MQKPKELESTYNRKKLEFKKLLKQPLLLGLIIFVFGFFFMFAFLPLYKVIVEALTGEEGFSGSAVASILSNKYFIEAFWNSIRLGLISATIASLVGFLFAFAITRTQMRGKKFFHFMSLFPIISPPFVIALSIILLFGRNGSISNGIFGITDSDIYGLRSLVLIQSLSFFPIAYMNLKGVLESIDGAMEDAGLSMGASRWKVFKTITLPLAIPGVFSSLLLVFIKSLEDFGNPIVIGGGYNTLATQAYLQIVGMYNLNSGAILGLILVVPSLTAFLIQKYWISKKSYVTVTGKPSQSSIQIREKYIVYPLFTLCALISASIVLLYGSVVWGSFVKVWGVDNTLTLDNYRYVFSVGFDAVKSSLTLAVIAAPLTAILGMVIAYLLVRKQFIGKKLMELSTILVFAVPGTVVGIGYILAFNGPTLMFTGTAAILIVVFMTRNISVGIEAGTNSLIQIDPSIEEASTNLGANGFTTFRKVVLPLMRSALFTGLVYSFVKSMTSISAVIFLVSVNWNLITVSILSQIEVSRMGRAAAYVMILIVTISIAIGIIQLAVNNLGFRKRRGNR